jgi:hypothetical protein
MCEENLFRRLNIALFHKNVGSGDPIE